MRPFRYLTIVLALSGMAACTGTQTTAEKSAPGLTGATTTRPNTLDMPALVGRNIDQIRRAMGPPSETKEQAIGIEPTAEQMRATKGEDWINTFEKNGSTIVVTFNARTRKVLDMVLIGSNEDELMRRGNLSLTAPNYLVLPVTDPRNAEQVSGLRVVSRR